MPPLNFDGLSHEACIVQEIPRIFHHVGVSIFLKQASPQWTFGRLDAAAIGA